MGAEPALLHDARDQAAIERLYDAWSDLTALGWEHPRHARLGEVFLAIQLGSTGVFKCTVTEDDKDRTFWIQDGGDLYPTIHGVALVKRKEPRL